MTTTPTDYTVTAAGQNVLDQIAYILQRGAKAAASVTADIAKNGLTHAIAWGEAEVVDAYMAEYAGHLADYIARETLNDAGLLAVLAQVRAEWANDVLSNRFRGNSTGELHRATSNLEREAVCRLIRELDGAIAYLTTTITQEA